MDAKKPFVLVVLDGWGHRTETTNNAIAAAQTPFFHHLWETYPHSLLRASAEDVGLPEGQMGNSEIGHMTIGAGAVIDTDLVRINKAARSGEFAHNAAFKKLFKHCNKHCSTLHVIGLLSEGGVHSHSAHLYAFLKAAKDAGVANVAVHAVTDGRDSSPTGSTKDVADLEQFLAETGTGRIASVCGRYFTMDRDNNWERLEKAEKAMFQGQAPHMSTPLTEHIREQYAQGIYDEHIEPLVCPTKDGDVCALLPNDGIFMFNYRADRARMLAKKLAARAEADNLCLVTMTNYDKTLKTNVAFPPPTVATTLASEISKAGLRQAHIAETEKYAHATYFLNGGREKPHDGEEHVLIESRKDVKTHDKAPEMRAREITDAAIERVNVGVDFIFINYANADMVGHTAHVPAIIKAVETVDTELKRLTEAVQAKGGALFITADHGNAEMNIDPETGERHTAHTLNVVPAILTVESGTLAHGSLADIAPTVLTVMGVPVPVEMTGRNLQK